LSEDLVNSLVFLCVVSIIKPITANTMFKQESQEGGLEG